MKEWEEYEDQIFDKLNSEFPDSDIRKNQKIKGIFSKRSRQVDILVRATAIGKNLKIVVDCKKFSKKVNVKTVESFIGFLEDVGAHLGILITNEGYTKSAHNRVENYTKDIRLDIVEFEKLEDYHFSWDSCNLCEMEEGIARGEIEWSEPQAIVKDGIITLIEVGECSYCSEKHVRCQGCGEIMNFAQSDEIECLCENIFGIDTEQVGQGLVEETINLRSQQKQVPRFVDPDQTNIFE